MPSPVGLKNQWNSITEKCWMHAILLANLYFKNEIELLSDLPIDLIWSWQFWGWVFKKCCSNMGALFFLQLSDESPKKKTVNAFKTHHCVSDTMEQVTVIYRWLKLIPSSLLVTYSWFIHRLSPQSCETKNKVWTTINHIPTFMGLPRLRWHMVQSAVLVPTTPKQGVPKTVTQVDNEMQDEPPNNHWATPYDTSPHSGDYPLQENI